jgi:curved DNA-binding protein CbpA
VLTHYDVLSVDPTAELETIRRAWRVKVRLLHPDKHRDSPRDVQAEAEKETLRVNVAWDTLRDPDKRHEYDRHLRHLRDAELEREREKDGTAADEEAAEDSRIRHLWLSSHSYLNLASFLIVVVATAFVVAGAVLLAHLTQ